MTTTPHTTASPQMSTDEALAFADTALGLAGHIVNDPAIRDLARQVGDGALTGDEAVRRAVAHVRGF